MSAPVTATLTAASLLAENTLDSLRKLVDVLRDRTALPIELSRSEGLHRSNTRQVWNNDIVWACGLLSARCIASGAVDAEIIAAPVFTGETLAVYRSFIVARADDHDSRCRIAINEYASWSGHHAYRQHVSLPDTLVDARMASPFSITRVTGSHRASIMALRSGKADRAAIDSSLWRFWSEEEPALLDGLTVVDETRDWPAPPFVLRRSIPVDTRAKLIDGLCSISKGDVPGLSGIVAASASQYRSLLSLAAE